ncbi:MAG: hypothetical protein WC393_03695 [Candidatus Nanoarchaeia archaeon]|jgi:hypothetical protein
MLITLLIPLSYIIGTIISRITKDEIIIRKTWFKNWFYLLALIIPSLLIGDEFTIIILSIINYIKSSFDLTYKKTFKSIILWNILLLIIGIIIIVDW